jgi:hypothetical protein
MKKRYITATLLVFLVPYIAFFYSAELSSFNTITILKHLATNNHSTFEYAEQAARNMDSFRAIHNKILNGTLPLRAVFYCLWQNGYGNRLYAVISVFVLAVLSDRAFLVPDWHAIDRYIEEPFNKSLSPTHSGLFSQYFNNSGPTKVGRFHVHDVTFNVKKAVSNMTSVTIENSGVNSSVARVRICDVDPYFFALCSNPLYYQKLYNLGLVERATIDDARHKLNNPNIYAPNVQLESILRVGFEVGGTFLSQ